MVGADETALICDLAETYGVYDYKALPLETAAALSSGLSDDSRIRMKLSGRRISKNTALLAGILDRLSFLAWAKTTDGVKGINRPESVLAILTGTAEQEKEKETATFRTPEEFEAARKKAIERAKGVA